MTILLLIGLVIILINFSLFAKEVLKKNKSNITYIYILFNVISSIGIIASIFQIVLKDFINPIFFENIIMSSIYLIPSFLLLLYLLFINKNLYSKLSVFCIFLMPCFFSALVITNPHTHLLYDEFNLHFSKLKPTILYYITILITILTVVIDYIVILVTNYNKNYILKNKLIALFFNTLFSVIFLILCYVDVISDTNIMVMIILASYNISAYFLIIRFQYINAVPFGLENAIGFLNSSVMIIDIHGGIVYTNNLARSFIKNILGIQLKINNLFDLLNAFDEELAQNVKYGLKNLYKVNGLMIQTSNIYGLNGKLYLQLQMYEVKGTEYYLLILRDVNQQHKELLDIKSKQNVINMQSQLATVGELALGVVHDINTPISALNTAIEILKSTQLTDTEKQILDTIDISAKKISVIASSIKDQFKNADSTEKIVFNLSEFINKVVFNIQHKLNDAKCSVTLDLDDSIKLTGNQSKLSQIFMNILFNSIKAYSELKTGGPIFIKSYKKKNNVFIEIKDNAGGIPENLRPHIFSNILTTKGTKGFGLGLYISNSIIQGEFDGKMNFTCDNNSTIITLQIPCVENAKGDN